MAPGQAEGTVRPVLVRQPDGPLPAGFIAAVPKANLRMQTQRTSLLVAVATVIRVVGGSSPRARFNQPIVRNPRHVCGLGLGFGVKVGA